MPSWVSFCRLTHYTERHLGFHLKDVFATTMVTNEALVSRFVLLESGEWIETRFLGLIGQSGCPLGGSDRLVRGMQVDTRNTRPAIFGGD